ncbi:hypothetical protein PORY_000090 [Pneumocystis oryctolagi]|uniref:Uncharacterized protein n=1 Tax=Pneumocystis oryctolagi TaxID=42067 RepID=A0ACB7CH77_9ASCO|nr:hypothetical protein PORY_000090 [Pneumocystis oryctolagi]
MHQEKSEFIKKKISSHKNYNGDFSYNGSEGKGSSRLKKKIRDLERLVKKGTIPADMQVNIEREIRSLRFDLKKVYELKKKHVLEEKYKMVRFFERKKAYRRLKYVQKQLIEARDENEKKRLQEIVHRCQVDFNYVVGFPAFKKYISLYKSPSETSSTMQERTMIWKDIEKKIKLKEGMNQCE